MLLDGINLQLKLLSDCYFHSVKSKKRSWFAFIVYYMVSQFFLKDPFKEIEKLCPPPTRLLKKLPLQTPKTFFLLFITGLPHGQEIRKSQEKMGVFEKKSGIVRKFDKVKKKSGFVRLIYKNPYFPKPSSSKKSIKNPLKSD